MYPDGVCDFLKPEETIGRQSCFNPSTPNGWRRIQSQLEPFEIWAGSALANPHGCLEGWLETIFMTTLRLQVNTYMQGTEKSTSGVWYQHFPIKNLKACICKATHIVCDREANLSPTTGRTGLRTPPYQAASTVLCQIWQTEHRHPLNIPMQPWGHCTPGDTKTGPDGSEAGKPCQGWETWRSTSILTACAELLADVYTDIFNLFLTQAVVPRSFVSSIIKPVPKKPDTSTLNDLSPVALTLVTMKCLAKLVLTHINSMVPEWTPYSLPTRSPTDQWTMLWPRLCTLHSNTWTPAEHMLRCSSLTIVPPSAPSGQEKWLWS